VDREELQRLGPQLEQFLENFAGCAVAPTRRLIATYVRGQLGSLPRKSVKPMALEAAVPPRTLQELLSLHRWDEELLLAMLQRRVRRAHPGPSAFGMIFESRCVKKGNRTPGVARQSWERSSRPRNCVVLIHLALSDGGFHCLLGSAVYLPESWIDDPQRRASAGIPQELRYRTRTQIALDLLRRVESSGLALGRWVIPSGYASEQDFVEALKAGGRSAVAAETGGKSVEASEPLMGSARGAQREVEEKMGEIGLDQFEVRTYRSLLRHLALSAASVLFLAEQAERARREPGSMPLRSHA
jgi:SRSO17 transposase